MLSLAVVLKKKNHIHTQYLFTYFITRIIFLYEQMNIITAKRSDTPLYYPLCFLMHEQLEQIQSEVVHFTVFLRHYHMQNYLN